MGEHIKVEPPSPTTAGACKVQIRQWESALPHLLCGQRASQKTALVACLPRVSCYAHNVETLLNKTWQPRANNHPIALAASSVGRSLQISPACNPYTGYGMAPTLCHVFRPSLSSVEIPDHRRAWLPRAYPRSNCHSAYSQLPLRGDTTEPTQGMAHRQRIHKKSAMFSAAGGLAQSTIVHHLYSGTHETAMLPAGSRPLLCRVHVCKPGDYHGSPSLHSHRSDSLLGL
mmetsp:Transcript_52954/g.124018  ORF Transcript_52954/g.124018 Transcript_52954/m.124018 type:complete len:229 (-) Transcript_52954:131-817(-)